MERKSKAKKVLSPVERGYNDGANWITMDETMAIDPTDKEVAFYAMIRADGCEQYRIAFLIGVESQTRFIGPRRHSNGKVMCLAGHA